jgi:hypothetical protein
MRDDSLPHQIRIFFRGAHSGYIAVSCVCLKQGGSYRPLESRTLWQPHEPMKVWRAHMAEVGAA